ncbi:hypothetical protein SRHO_G00116090 [Serrasalmus rhombeus]
MPVIFFPKRYTSHSGMHYHPKEKQVYAWDDGYQTIYKLDTKRKITMKQVAVLGEVGHGVLRLKRAAHAPAGSPRRQAGVELSRGEGDTLRRPVSHGYTSRACLRPPSENLQPGLERTRPVRTEPDCSRESQWQERTPLCCFCGRVRTPLGFSCVWPAEVREHGLMDRFSVPPVFFPGGSFNEISDSLTTRPNTEVTRAGRLHIAGVFMISFVLPVLRGSLCCKMRLHEQSETSCELSQLKLLNYLQ